MALSHGDLRAVIARYPELRSGLVDHLDEVVRIATRIVEAEQRPAPEPVPWAGLTDLERRRAFHAAYPPRGKGPKT
jgi:hypothetical protein